MTDLFALMDEPRRPWIDPDALKAKFLKLSASLHPDRAHNSTGTARAEAHRRFTDINSAFHSLQDPRQRLRHLLELETGSPPAQVDAVPPGLMEVVLEIGNLCRQADALLEKKIAASSPLLQVEIFQQGQEWTERLAAVQNRISQRRELLLQSLQALDAQWMENRRMGRSQPGELISELAELYRLLGYVHRWSSQVQERIVRLMT